VGVLSVLSGFCFKGGGFDYCCCCCCCCRYFNKRDPVEVLEADPDLVRRAQVRWRTAVICVFFFWGGGTGVCTGVKAGVCGAQGVLRAGQNHHWRCPVLLR
jgi:hypothetical protein